MLIALHQFCICMVKKMKKILDDYAPILNAKQVDALPLEITEESESKHKNKKAKNCQQQIICNMTH